MLGFDGFGLLASASIVWIIIDWIIRVGALFVVPRNRKPSSGTAWLMVIFLFPIGGLILYLILGSPKLPKTRRDAQKTLDQIIARTFKEFQHSHDSQQSLHAQVPKHHVPVARLSESLTRLPVLAGNEVEVLSNYDNIIKRIIKDIDRAEHYVHLEYFIIALDEVTEPLFAAIAQAVKRGVIVRVMYDSFSSRRYPQFKQMLQRMKQDGVLVQAMLPFRFPGRGYVRPDLRNHRKLVVIDGQTGYTGSQNLIRRNYHRKDDIYYDELAVRLQGPVVLELLAVFLSDWYSETGSLLGPKELKMDASQIKSAGTSLAQVLPSGPGYEDENNLKLFTDLIHAAREQITITNPYFVPDEALTTAITSAARRGVKVTMINSEAMDQLLVGHAQRSFYEELLKAGVRIYLYNAPVLLHSKFMTIDNDLATIGSSNLDIRSFLLDLEVTLISYDARVVRKLRTIEKDYLSRSKPIMLAEWQARPRHKILLDNLARLTSALQ